MTVYKLVPSARQGTCLGCCARSGLPGHPTTQLCVTLRRQTNDSCIDPEHRDDIFIEDTPEAFAAYIALTLEQ